MRAGAIVAVHLGVVIVEVSVPRVRTATHRRTPIVDVSTSKAELQTIGVAVAGGHRAETGPCTGSNRFAPVCILSNTTASFPRNF
jgi:hypothetical protein